MKNLMKRPDVTIKMMVFPHDLQSLFRRIDQLLFPFVCGIFIQNMVGLAGPIIVSRIFQQTGDYRNVFLVALIFAVIGLTLSFVYDRIKS